MRRMRRTKQKDCFTDIEEVLLGKILKEIKKMAATLQDLKDAITEIHTAVDADLAQTAIVITKINELIAALANAGNTDFQAEVDAVKAATAKLASDNAAVQAALDAAPTSTPA